MPKLVCTIALLLIVGSSAAADSPASIPESGRDRAGAAFDAFAARWMGEARESEQHDRANPSVAPGAAAPLITYRGFGDDYDLELRPTGNPSAPYVGLLRYTEHVYNCASLEIAECTIVSSIPVTEIFRYQKGRWRY